MKIRFLPHRTDPQKRRALLGIEATERELDLAMGIAYLVVALVFLYEVYNGHTLLTPLVVVLLFIRICRRPALWLAQALRLIARN